jgi:4-hydroxy-tetrahydrodipicolinate synthase
MEELRGTGVALITPFDDDNQIDFPSLERLVHYQIDNGVDYLVVLGTTGETATLTTREKAEVRSCVLKANAGRLPVVLGIGGNSTQAVVEELRATDLSGFKAILSVSPYYNKPSQEGIYRHFKEVSRASDLPVIIYNVPPRTGSNILPETTLRLARDFDNIIAVKEASGDFEQALDLLRDKPADFMIISGEDKLALPLVLAGGAGVISVIGQGLPKEFSEMIRLGLDGRSKEAFEVFYQVLDSIDLIFEEGNPSGIKCLLNILEISSDSVRLPLVPASEDLRQKMIKFVATLKN